MNCTYCCTWNSEDEHRCTNCGRRLKLASVSPTYPASRSLPAYALAAQPAAVMEPAPVVEVDEPAPRRLRAPIPQKLGFEDRGGCNIIPFESFAGHRLQQSAQESSATTPAVSERISADRSATVTKPAVRRRTPAVPKNDLQADLEFLLPAPQGPRTLKTQVEAVIYCDAEVASPKHRAIAAAIDGGMIFTGFGLFLFAFHMLGGMFRFNRQTIPFFVGLFGTLAMFYGVLWIWAGRETLGMRWTGLRLIDFDGFPAGRRNRALRAVGACLSLSAAGLGLLWALVDEERLAWHDHMSKTFPTLEESNRPFYRKP